MKTLQEMAAAIDRALPLCEAISEEPGDCDTRQALTLALAPIGDESFLEPCRQAKPENPWALQISFTFKPACCATA